MQQQQNERAVLDPKTSVRPKTGIPTATVHKSRSKMKVKESTKAGKKSTDATQKTAKTGEVDGTATKKRSKSRSKSKSKKEAEGNSSPQFINPVYTSTMDDAAGTSQTEDRTYTSKSRKHQPTAARPLTSVAKLPPPSQATASDQPKSFITDNFFDCVS